MINTKRKGKPFERMGRKAFDLKAAKAVYGGWVAEVGVVRHLLFKPTLTLNPFRGFPHGY